MSPRLVLLAALLALAFIPTAYADTTLRHRIEPSGGAGYQPLTSVKGENYVVRRGGGAKARAARTHHRRSLVLFAQLTDPQIADEMSPARVDFADPAGGEIKSSWRPQEALGLQVFDSVVRNVNANRAQPGQAGQRQARQARVRAHDRRPRRQPAAERDALVPDRARRRARSTRSRASRSTTATRAPARRSATIASINADVAARHYTGVADYDDYASAPDDRYAGFWDPDEAAPVAGPYSAFPRYPGPARPRAGARSRPPA